jgi:hypothetical protein
MNTTPRDQRTPEQERLRQRCQELRDALLALHKRLVESERVTYEAVAGPIPSPNRFLQLLTEDPWFAWLRPLSGFIVSMDEALDGEEPLTAKVVEGFETRIRTLLVASETGEGFAAHYDDALQRDPDVILAHGVVSRLLDRRKDSAS